MQNKLLYFREFLVENPSAFNGRLWNQSVLFIQGMDLAVLLKNCLVSTVMGYRFENLVRQSILTWNTAPRYCFKTIFQMLFLKKVLGDRKNFHMLVNIWELKQKGDFLRYTKLNFQVR